MVHVNTSNQCNRYLRQRGSGDLRHQEFGIAEEQAQLECTVTRPALIVAAPPVSYSSRLLRLRAPLRLPILRPRSLPGLPWS